MASQAIKSVNDRGFVRLKKYDDSFCIAAFAFIIAHPVEITWAELSDKLVSLFSTRSMTRASRDAGGEIRQAGGVDFGDQIPFAVAHLTRRRRAGIAAPAGRKLAGGSARRRLESARPARRFVPSLPQAGAGEGKKP